MARVLQSLGWVVATCGASAAVRGVTASYHNAVLVAQAETLGLSPRDRRLEKLVNARSNRALAAGALAGLSSIGWYWVLDRTIGRFTASSSRFPWLRGARILKPLPLLACVLLEAGATMGSVGVASNTEVSVSAARTALIACLVTGKSFVPPEHSSSSVFTRKPAASAAATYFAAASDGVEEMRLGQWARVGGTMQLLGAIALYGLVPFAWRVPLGAALGVIAWSPAEDGSDVEALVNIVEAFAGEGSEASERRELAQAVVESLTMRAIRSVSMLQSSSGESGPDDSILADEEKVAVLALAMETAVGMAVLRMRREGRARERRSEASDDLVAALRAADAADSHTSIVSRVGCALLLAAAMPEVAANIVPGGHGGLVVERDANGVGFEWDALEGLVRWVAKPGNIDVPDLREIIGSKDEMLLQAVQLALEVAWEAMEEDEGTPWGTRMLEGGMLRVSGSDEEQSDPLLLAVGGQAALDAVATERDDLSLGWQQQHLQRSISRVPEASTLGRR